MGKTNSKTKPFCRRWIEIEGIRLMCTRESHRTGVHRTTWRAGRKPVYAVWTERKRR